MNDIYAEAPVGGDIRFGPFFLNVSSRRLRHNATTVPLKPKEAELLVLLATSLGKAVPRDEIMESLWGLHKATDYALSQTVYRLRRALENFDPTGDYVRTIPGIGYHLVAPTIANGTFDSLAFRDPAFQPYQQAMLHFKGRTQSHITESIASFEAALAINPTFVPALTGLAKVYVSAGVRSLVEPLTAYYRAKNALARAIELDPTAAEAFPLLSMLTLFFDADLSRARDAAEQAVLLAPQSAQAHLAMVWQSLAREDHAAALTEADRALRANPTDAHSMALLGIALYMLRRYDEASGYFAESMRLSPLYAPGIFYCACTYYMSGRYDDAHVLLNRMPGSEMSSREIAVRGCIAARQGNDAARKRFEAELAALPYRCDVSIAAIHIASGNLDAAAASLTEALETREPGLFLATVDPMYEPLQTSHPLLISTIRKGRRSRCDRCAISIIRADGPLHAVRLCAACTTATN
ncbi:MAG TPA: winged helix-turn-helix domain-containing protein [Candidatus Baltobacteraceae bacterium]|nr:winged helix-turn-helix domain-containing protein [Candidatus Baltobacteraceae bacterium]